MVGFREWLLGPTQEPDPVADVPDPQTKPPPDPAPSLVTCASCKFWCIDGRMFRDAHGNEFSAGECRRHAPQPQFARDGGDLTKRLGWPGTLSHEWCGEGSV